MAPPQPPPQGPVVLVTGCTEGGIGHALSAYLYGRGCRVFATARRAGAAGDLESLGIPVIALDVQWPESCADAVDEVVAAAGRIDVLVNNAGARRRRERGALRGASAANLGLQLATRMAPLRALLDRAVPHCLCGPVQHVQQLPGPAQPARRDAAPTTNARAGIVTLGPTCEVPMDVVQKSFETNVFGLLQVGDTCRLRGRRLLHASRHTSGMPGPCLVSWGPSDNPCGRHNLKPSPRPRWHHPGIGRPPPDVPGGAPAHGGAGRRQDRQHRVAHGAAAGAAQGDLQVHRAWYCKRLLVLETTRGACAERFSHSPGSYGRERHTESVPCRQP